MVEQNVGKFVTDRKPLPVSVVPSIDADEFFADADERRELIWDECQWNDLKAEKGRELIDGHGGLNGPHLLLKDIQRNLRCKKT